MEITKLTKGDFRRWQVRSKQAAISLCINFVMTEVFRMKSGRCHGWC